MTILEKVCGVIVSYNPTELIMGTIINACLVLESAIVVDNSTDFSLFYKLKVKLETLKICNPEKKIIIIKNESNLGLPKSYNKAVSLAKEFGFHSVLLLDQDSLISKDSLMILIDDRIKILKSGIKVGAIGMHHDQNHYFHSPIGFLFNDKFRWRNMIYLDYIEEKRMLINSGMLISIENYQSVNGYDEAFFLDNSDLEFSLRLRKKGLRLFESLNSRMLHNYGEQNDKTPFYVLPYRDPKREYYVRDLVRCIKIAKSVSSIDFGMLMLLTASKIIGTLIFKENRKERFRYIVSGLKEGFGKEGRGQSL